jgi:hypothetical protein
VAHLLVWEFVKLMTGVAPVVPYVYYDLMAQRVFAPEGATPRPRCLACSPEGWLAGGREVLLDAIRSARSAAAERSLPPGLGRGVGDAIRLDRLGAEEPGGEGAGDGPDPNQPAL